MDACLKSWPSCLLTFLLLLQFVAVCSPVFTHLTHHQSYNARSIAYVDIDAMMKNG